MLHALSHNLNELITLLRRLSDRQYAQQFEVLSGASIGEHTRHMVEMLQCLHQPSGNVVNYDKRPRDQALQSETATAIDAIGSVLEKLEVANRDLILEQVVGSESVQIQSNYHRELLYNLEHCIHHQALIKVAMIQLGITADRDFGVARSTIEYRNRCAQ
ncbi:MAG: DinB family protein [Flavobacterium sp.]|nr:DinB family protein [Flavobacterium sp.]